LWIARTGLCYFDIEVVLSGRRVINKGQLHHIRDMVLGFEVGTMWCPLEVPKDAKLTALDLGSPGSAAGLH
jgi:hypothetical protein